MRRTQSPSTATLLRHGEGDVVNARGDVGVKGQPAKLRDAETQSLREFRGSGEHRQAGSLESLDVTLSLSQASRHTSSKEEDVCGPAVGDGLGSLLLALGGL